DVTGGFTNFGAPVRPDGTFQLRLPPGEYELEARSMPVGIAGPPGAGSEQFGLERITVAGDVTGLAIQLGSGASVSGRIGFDGTSPVPRVPNNRNFMGLVAFTPADGTFCRVGQPELAPDWTFRIDGLFGTCIARPNGAADRWLVKSISHNGKDLLDQPVTFTPGQQLRDVEVVMTDKRTELNFHVTDEQGTPTREYVGLLFTVDKTRWTNTTGRYVRTLYVPPAPPGDASFSTAPGGAGANMALVGRVTGGV